MNIFDHFLGFTILVGFFQISSVSAEQKSGVAGRGGGGLTSFGSNAIGPPVSLISFDGRLAGLNEASKLTEAKAGISLPLYRSEKDVFALSLTGGRVSFTNSIRLSDGTQVSREWSRIELGSQYSRSLEEKRRLGLRGSIGYAGDAPERGSHDLSYSASASYGYPGASSGYWMWFVFMSNNSPLANYIPIPGVVYVYRTERLNASLGLPVLSVQWTPSSYWAYAVSLFGPNFQSEAAYGDRNKSQVFAGYTFLQQSFIPKEKLKDRDRLRISEQRTLLGFRALLADSVLAELTTEYAFGRRVYVSDSFFRKNRATAGLPDDFGLNLSFKIRF
jgi:hypothetical protein